MKAKRYITDEYQQKGEDMNTKYIKVSMAIGLLLCFFPIYHLDAQKLLWKANFTGNGNNYPSKSIIDSQDNIYIIGTFNDTCDLPAKIKTKGGNDIYIVKYNSSGNLLWTKQIGSTTSDFATGIVISPDDKYIYVTGSFQGPTLYANNLSITNSSSGTLDGFLAKYNNNGDIIWLKSIASGIGATNQRANDIKIDKNNHLVLGGYFYTNVVLIDTTLTTTQPIGMFIAQFDTSGYRIKAKKYDSSSGSSVLYTFDIDTSGYYLCGSFGKNLYIDLGTKTSVSPANDSTDMFLYKLNFNLEGEWFIKIAGTKDDNLFSCSADNKGYVYIGGHFKSPTLTVDSNRFAIPSQRIAHNTTTDGKTDVFFAKYSHDGVLQWFNNFGSKQNDLLYRALYKNGDFIMAGQYGDTIRFSNQMITSKNTADAFAIVQDENNNLVYLIPIGGHGDDLGETSVVDNKGNFIVIGDYKSTKIYFSGDSLINSQSDNTRDMFVAKYDKGSISISKTDISCTGYNNGIAIAHPKGALVYPLTYQWTKKNDATFTAATQMISNVSPGTYYVQVTDAINYVLHDSVEFTAPVALTLTVNSAIDVKCYGGTNGAINITASEGTLPYHYLWHSTNGSGLKTISKDQDSLSAGTYYATVTDNKGCTAAISGVTIGQPTPMTTSAIVTPTTPGSSVGAIDLSVSGGVYDYTYLWSNAATAQDINSLGEGNYFVTITDARLCTKITSFYVPIMDSVAISYTSTNVSCHGGSNGVIDLTVTGGTGGYTYSWSRNGVPLSGRYNDSINSLDSARYTVTVKDRNGSGLPRTIYFDISQPKVLTSSIVKADINCFGQDTGVADLKVKGGTLPYSYAWIGPLGYTSNIEDISGLDIGVYNVTVTDINNCTTTNSTSITEPTALSVTTIITTISCYGEKNNGSIALNVSGGVSPYAYTWSNGPTTASMSLLPSGIYRCTVTDGNNCMHTTTQNLSLPLPITATFTNNNITCYGAHDGILTVNPSGGNDGFTYLWSNSQTSRVISSLASGTYLVTVTDIKNCTGIFDTIVPPQPDSLSVSLLAKQDADCKGSTNGYIHINVGGGTTTYQYAWSNGVTIKDNDGIKPNTYTLTVTDQNNCTKSFGEVVNDLHKSYVNISISTITNVKCNGSADGSISAAASGGAEPYKFYLKLNGVATGDTTGISSGSFTGLEPVSGYTIEAYDKNECGPDTSETVSITEPIALSITGESAQNATAKYPWNGSLTVVASGGTGRLTYTLDTLSQDDGLFTNLSPGSYKVTVIDQNACGPDTSSILTISDATDIPGLVQGTIRMYPNPARDNLIIEFGEEVTKDVLIEIMSMTGQVVFKVKLNKDVLRDGRYTFDLASQPRGVYLLKINNQVVKEKIVLQ